MITPQNIIDTIKDTYNVDITPKKQTGVIRNLKSMYFYLCVKYCNPVLFGYQEIGRAVSVKHPNVVLMANKASERIDVKGWENYTSVIKKLDHIISETYSTDEDYLSHIKLDDISVLRLKRRIKEQDKRNRMNLNRVALLKNKKVDVVI